jgi:hypothetical protein
MLAAPAPAGAQTPPRTLIDVPYVAQTPELCGGAALAMVLRYWGDPRAAAQDFAPLVDRDLRGIRTDALADAARQRGWQSLATRAGAVPLAEVDAHISRGRPLIALIQERPGELHYVVVVARTAEAVIVHDPARAPFRVMPLDEFDRRWSATSRWMMLVLPGDSRTLRQAPPVDVRGSDGATEPCGALVDHSVERALAGDHDTADQGLVAASGLCPRAAAPWRELAGLRAVQGRWSDARAYAERAVALAGDDDHAWRVLGTARFVTDDRAGALDAWNRAQSPRVSSVSVLGAKRTRHPVVIDLVGLEPGDLLTSAALDRATRRVQQLPAASAAMVRYRPVEDGDADVEAVIEERRLFPGGLVDWGGIGARVLLKEELKLWLSGATGSGDVLSGSWRWETNRPRVTGEFALPAPGALPGIVSVSGLWERQTYAVRTDAAEAGSFTETRRRGGVQFSDWLTHRLKWTGGLALDRIGGHRHVSIDGALDRRWMGDLMSTAISVAGWFPGEERERFAVSDVSLAWRVDRRASSPWQGIVGLTIASENAPFAVWPSAGTGGSGRGALLRAHPLHEDGIITSENFAKQLAYFTVEHQRPLVDTKFGDVRWVMFMDVVRAWGGLPGPPRRLQADVGGGVRFGSGGGGVRFDVGYGLRDQSWAVSAGWMTEWPWR